MIGALFGLGCALAVLGANFAPRRRDREDAKDMAFMLVCAWGFSKLVTALAGWEVSTSLFPMTDSLQACIAAHSWLKRGRAWKIVLVATLLAKFVPHILFGAAFLADARQYYATLNVAFAVELAVVASVGGIGIGRTLGRWLVPSGAWVRRPLLQAQRARP